MTKKEEQSDRTDLAVIKEQVSTIRGDVKDIKTKLELDYVTKDQFEPIKRLVYGLVGLILTAVVVAILSLILKK